MTCRRASSLQKVGQSIYGLGLPLLIPTHSAHMFTARMQLWAQHTQLLVNECSSIQVCWGEWPHQNGSSPPTMVGHMIERQRDIGLFGHPQLPVIAYTQPHPFFNSMLELLCHKFACMVSTNHHYQTAR